MPLNFKRLPLIIEYSVLHLNKIHLKKVFLMRLLVTKNKSKKTNVRKGKPTILKDDSHL